MPARDLYHNQLKNALVKEGWTITHDPLRLKWGAKDMYADLGAEKVMVAEKQGRKIAIEIKSFVSSSDVNDLEDAIGQYFLYRSVLSRTEPDRMLYLAVHDEVYFDLFEEPLGKIILEDYEIPLIVFDPRAEAIVKWIR